MSPFTLGPFAMYLKKKKINNNNRGKKKNWATGQGPYELLRATVHGKTTGEAIPQLQRIKSYGRPGTGLKCHLKGGHHGPRNSLPSSTPTLGPTTNGDAFI